MITHTRTWSEVHKMKVIINYILHQIQVTTLLPFFLSILHLLLQLSKIMLWSTVKLLLTIVMSIILVHENVSEVIENLRLRNFQGSKVSFFDLSTLYTSLSHDFIKAKVLSLVNRESKSYICTSLKAGYFSNKNMTQIDVGLARSYVKLLFSSYGKNICAIWLHSTFVYQQIVVFTMGTNCAPLIADLFLYCYETDFMSDLHKS